MQNNQQFVPMYSNWNNNMRSKYIKKEKLTKKQRLKRHQQQKRKEK